MSSREVTDAPLRRSATEEALQQGRALLDEGRAPEALICFATAHEGDPTHARARSYYALALAIAERSFEQSVELARSALKQEFFNPELYLNLARIHLHFGFKSEGLRYLRRGQMIDPSNGAIRCQLEELGMRQSQVLRFLRRGHLLNRWLGRARARWLGVRSPVPAAPGPADA